jgi:hypothetical protein
MAAANQTVPALLTLEEHLQTSYRPDCDFMEGVLEERKVGGTKHGTLQMHSSIAARIAGSNLLLTRAASRRGGRIRRSGRPRVESPA